MPLPPVTPTAIALNNSSPGTTDLFGKMLLGTGIGVAIIALGAVVYSKINPADNYVARSSSATGGTRRTRRKHRKA